VLTLPSISWVAGRTGFGTAVAAGKDEGSLKTDRDHVEGGLGHSAMEESVHLTATSDIARGLESVLTGAEESIQVSNLEGGDPLMGCAASGSVLPEGVISEGGLEESVVVETIDSPGQGLVLSEVVGSVVGITCDGQEGMKVNCFKRIIVGNQGERETAVDDAVQQETVRSERGNCSDYEA
jgi:hypothetical protein